MDRDKNAWENNRPIFDRLPAYGYRDNALVKSLTDGPDSDLIDTYGTAGAFYNELYAPTAQDSSLDYLAALVGFSEEYWDLKWTPEVKRDFLVNVDYLWRNRGTIGALEKVLGIHGIDHAIWTPGQLNLTFNLPGVLGGDSLRVYIKLPLNYSRTSTLWREAERTSRLWLPAFTKNYVSYDQLYLGFSLLGDPLF